MIARTLFAEEHEIFRTSVRKFIEAEITPYHAQWEKSGVVPRSVWQKAGAAGLLCCNIPEEYGGMGGDFLHSIVVLEELARAGASGPCFTLQSDIIAPYLLHYGTDEQKRKWLPPLSSGHALISIGMTEPSGGSDLQNMKTTALRDDDHYVINGQKVFITNAVGADVILLACKTDPTQRAKGISLLLVETDRQGFARGRLLEKVGCKAQDTSELFFHDVRVPALNLVGEEGRGFYHLMAELAQERLVQAARAVAVAEAAVETTVDYTRQRRAFGQTIADFQNTRFKLAEMHAETAVNRTFVDRCIELHMRGELSASDAAMAKMSATELQGRVLDQCVQLHGGWGYMWEMPIARAYADARMQRLAGGSTEVLKQIVANALFRAP